MKNGTTFAWLLCQDTAPESRGIYSFSRLPGSSNRSVRCGLFVGWLQTRSLRRRGSRWTQTANIALGVKQHNRFLVGDKARTSEKDALKRWRIASVCWYFGIWSRWLVSRYLCFRTHSIWNVPSVIPTCGTYWIISHSMNGRVCLELLLGVKGLNEKRKIELMDVDNSGVIEWGGAAGRG